MDKTILKLIKSGLKARVFLKDKTAFTPEVGTPQGGILSPLLSNIYLHELDRFMEKLNMENQGPIKPSNRKKNPTALSLLRRGEKSTYHKLRIPSRITNEEGYRTSKYLRYADDFLVGVVGPRHMAEKIREQINTFLQDELKINLSMEKTNITHISKEIPFLGYKFTRRLLFIKQHYSNKLVTRKMIIPILDVNMKRVIDRLKEARFCDGNGNPLPAFR